MERSILKEKGRGGSGQVVRVLAFSADDPSSNPSEVYNISVKILLIRMKFFVNSGNTTNQKISNH